MAKSGGPANLRADINGTAKTLKALDVLRKKHEGAFRGAVYILATNIVSTAIKLTPADTGMLRASRYVRRPSLEGTKFSCEVGFGAPYAIFVHEIDKAYVVGEWKFLAKSVDYHLPSAARDLALWTGKLAQEGRTVDDVPETHPRVWTGGDRFGRGHTGGPGVSRQQMQHLTPSERRDARKANRKSKATRKRQRARDRKKNVERIRRESRESLDAQRNGKRRPRPGR